MQPFVCLRTRFGEHAVSQQRAGVRSRRASVARAHDRFLPGQLQDVPNECDQSGTMVCAVNAPKDPVYDMVTALQDTRSIVTLPTAVVTNSLAMN